MRIFLFLWLSLVSFAKEIDYKTALNSYKNARYMKVEGKCVETVKVVGLDESLKESVGILFEGYYVVGKMSKKDIPTRFYVEKDSIKIKTENKEVFFFASKEKCKRNLK